MPRFVRKQTHNPLVRSAARNTEEWGKMASSFQLNAISSKELLLLLYSSSIY